MSLVVLLVQSWPERNGPSPAGAAGLALALLTIVVLAIHQVRASWLEHTAPGPVPSQEPAAQRESRHLYWAVTTVLIVVLGVVVVERFVVMT